ncbi:MAG: tryptophan 7-halogenase [Pseudomonadota bacterium]|nr:tryptophan 7-halogenase [Pseudomonadota bacterium]
MAEAGPEKQKIVVLGGETAGWMTAAALVRLLPHACTVRLVESEEIGIVAAGEATLPHLRAFVQSLGIDEADFMRATHATFKLGIDFRDFGRIGESYIHPFGSFGTELNGVAFHHYWLRMRAAGRRDDLFSYSIANVMAAENRFAPPAADTNSLLSAYGYAYQFDATLFGPISATMRSRAVPSGRRAEWSVSSSTRRPATSLRSTCRAASEYRDYLARMLQLSVRRA